MPHKPAVPSLFRLLSYVELAEIRGKASIGRATPAELASIFRHIDTMEMKLDEVDGPGWRKALGHPDAE